MYLIIPLILIGGGIAGISYVVWPKFRVLKGREDLPEVEEDFWRLIFPELFKFLRVAGDNYKTSKENLIVGYEKFLRRAKILSMRTDNTINKLLEKRPRVRSDIQKTEFRRSAKAGEGIAVHQFKNRETHLIAEISRNPKDKDLYKALGVLYMENKMSGDARDAFSVVLELDPNDGEARERLEKLMKIM